MTLGTVLIYVFGFLLGAISALAIWAAGRGE
jgi:hypothetical protein